MFWFNKEDSVDQVVAVFHKTVEKLERLAQSKTESAAWKSSQAAQFVADSEVDRKEAEKANKVRDKILDIVGDE